MVCTILHIVDFGYFSSASNLIVLLVYECDIVYTYFELSNVICYWDSNKYQLIYQLETHHDCIFTFIYRALFIYYDTQVCYFV